MGGAPPRWRLSMRSRRSAALPGGGGARRLAEPRMAMERRPYRGEGGPSWRFSGLRGSAGFGILSTLPAKGARVSETAVKFQRLRA